MLEHWVWVALKICTRHHNTSKREYSNKIGYKKVRKYSMYKTLLLVEKEYFPPFPIVIFVCFLFSDFWNSYLVVTVEQYQLNGFSCRTIKTTGLTNLKIRTILCHLAVPFYIIYLCNKVVYSTFEIINGLTSGQQFLIVLNMALPDILSH